MRQTKAPPESFHPISDSDMDLDLERDDATSLSSPRSARDTASSNYFGATGSQRQLEPAISEDRWPRRLRDTRDKPGPAETSDPFTAAEEEFMVDEEDGEDLSPSLATFLTKRFQTQTDPKKLKAKFDHYKRPANNCHILTAPQTNKEIWRSLKIPTKRTDVKMNYVQNQISKATIALARCADDLAKSNINTERLTSLTDAMILLGHTHKSVTNLRRDLMRYLLLPDFKTLCDTTTEASNTLLYGDDIKQSLKDAREHGRLTDSLQQEFRFKRSTPNGPF